MVWFGTWCYPKKLYRSIIWRMSPPNFWRFLPSQILVASVTKVVPKLARLPRGKSLEKVSWSYSHQARSFIGAHTDTRWILSQISSLSQRIGLPVNFCDTTVPVGMCASKPYSISTACKKIEGAAPTNDRKVVSRKRPFGCVQSHVLLSSYQSSPDFSPNAARIAVDDVFPIFTRATLC